VAVAVAFWIIFNVFDGLLFFSPFLDFYYLITQDVVPGFIMSLRRWLEWSSA
jgi:hypothetical protein